MKSVLISAAIVVLLVASISLAQEWTEKKVVATIDSDGVQRVEITGGAYYFDPNVIVVKVNVPVELKVKKADSKPHDIVIKAPEAGMDFSESLSKDPKTIKFTPTKVGTYDFKCSKKAPFSSKSHADQGMHGRIEVVE